jgi:glycosyltransferase involved in cell wall biosynthesis
LAIETVRRQELPEWEIIVSDNQSDEDVGGYVKSLQDERILYQRTPAALTVTDNWNAALALSSGDYVLMLGDDDGLLPGYISRMQELVERFHEPEMIYTGALLFAYPGVDPAHPRGFLASNTHAEFFGEATEAFILKHDRAVAAVRRVMDFRLAFNFNMQLSLISRGLIEAMRDHGEFFQSAFPDYYATSAALLEAPRIVADPSARVVIGVTPKSYGFFHLNEREEEGRQFLGGQHDQTLPGTNINDGWFSAMLALEANYGPQYRLRVNRRRYRFLQASYVYTAKRRGNADVADVARLEAGLPSGERALYRGANILGRAIARAIPRRLWLALMRRAQGQFPDWKPEREDGQHRDLLDVFEDVRVPASL